MHNDIVLLGIRNYAKQLHGYYRFFTAAICKCVDYTSVYISSIQNNKFNYIFCDSQATQLTGIHNITGVKLSDGLLNSGMT